MRKPFSGSDAEAVGWLGGLPYEYAALDLVVGFLVEHGFRSVPTVITRRQAVINLSSCDIVEHVRNYRKTYPESVQGA